LNIDQRRREPEWMDEPQLDAHLHAQALAGLRRINWFSGTAPVLWSAIAAVAAHNHGRPFRVLDVGCGGGDVGVALARRGASGVPGIRIEGCDISDFTIGYARRYADSKGVANVRFFQHDILADPLPDEYDVVMCSLFLHHFDEDDAVRVLGRFRSAARQLVLIHDLRRTSLGYMLAWLGCRLLSRSPVVHVDGPLSVAGAFREDEVVELAKRAGLMDPEIKTCWPERLLMSARTR
jgi:2-polyprenyl-3-methyl-5-hydroxy-6-metoxy-1,4-benzoquinol methylase